jgi:hemoglobin/transferrin/lactoferrin receptor protein
VSLSGLSANVIGLTGEDESERNRVAFDYNFDNPGGFIDNLFVSVYAQESWLRQFTYEDRTPAVDRTRETT